MRIGLDIAKPIGNVYILCYTVDSKGTNTLEENEMNALESALKYNDHFNKSTFTSIESILWDEVDNDMVAIIMDRVIDVSLAICGDKRFSKSWAKLFNSNISSRAKWQITRHLTNFIKN
jgi:hypothetical protein